MEELPAENARSDWQGRNCRRATTASLRRNVEKNSVNSGQLELLSQSINRSSRLAGAPYRTRTGVFAVRGRRPGPLDEGSVGVGIALIGHARKLAGALKNPVFCCRKPQGAAEKFSRPAGCSVLTSKVRTSSLPSMSSV